MDSIKNMMAVVGLITVIIVASVSVIFVINGGDAFDDSEGASSSDIKADLKRYAELLNDPNSNAILYVNFDIFFETNRLHNYTCPIKGTVSVEGLNLVFDNWANTEHLSTNHWIIPYHAISAVKIH